MHDEPRTGVGGRVLLAGYSALLSLALVVSAPWWLLRMATAQRYREGLRERLGRVPRALRETAAGRRVVWVHAVSVGEVLAVSRLVRDLEAALNDGVADGAQQPWHVVVSTTTRTGQALARERFGGERVFYFPLDFALAVRAFLRALQPELLILAESELWPRMLHECGRAGVPVAVVNARVSDRSFRRSLRVRGLWARMGRKVSLWLAQSQEDARRLVALGAPENAVRVSGNLKFDVRAIPTEMVDTLKPLLKRRQLVIAGSLVEPEEQALLSKWWDVRSRSPEAVLLLAPRHPERFEEVAGYVGGGMTLYRATELKRKQNRTDALTKLKPLAIVLLDTVGDLASVYALADAAFVGGSLAPQGGHNPLEPARFGVPVVMGPSFENFRTIVDKMRAADGIRIVRDKDDLGGALMDLLTHLEDARALGERGRKVFESEGGATARSIEALMGLVNINVQAAEAVSA